MSDPESEGQVVNVPGLESARALGTPTVTTSATWTWLVEGYRRARVRLREATGQLDARETFIPLFETLNWAVVLIDYAEKRGPRIDGKVLSGLRLARNRVHHQWADALEPRDVPFAQVITSRREGSRVVAPSTVVDWYWKPLAQLPPPDERHKDRPEALEAYEDCLAGKPARLALDDFDSLLSRADSGEGKPTAR